MWQDMITFVAILNPLALFLYLLPVMRQLSNADFTKVLIKASFISYAVFAIFAATGMFIFDYVFQIKLDSFRIFGGLLFTYIAGAFIIQGGAAFIQLRENLDDTASHIAMPYMVGAATISLSILMNVKYSYFSYLYLAISMCIAFAVIIILKYIRALIEKKAGRAVFDKNVSLFMRINAFFIGSIGIDMIVTGIKNLFF